MATAQTRNLARTMMAPAVVLLFIWMIVPLVMTLWFSFQNYSLINPMMTGFAGLANYTYVISDPSFVQALINTLILVLGVLIITVIGGTFIALLLDQPIWGQGILRILVISPFFVMPPVAALIWKNGFMHADYGLISHLMRFVGLKPIDWFAQYPLLSVIIIVAWQWLPFATLILLTALQSLSEEQREAAEMDGANAVNRFWYIIMPHMSRAVTIVILIQTIFLLGIFAEIRVTTGGGPGFASTNIAFLVFRTGILSNDIGAGSAGGVVAVIIANIVAFFLMRAVGKNLDA
ncbi:MAG: sugar transporter permease [Devosia sp.]|uniref:carbohydrate ABC transporter permease n=1 Tax=Devosia sp. TaxID=1871048 RepID=UPI0026138B0F|nr:sugar ABC transporter permease [Devosia sp.]MDB5527615.1 sugar transporter permease [Devosia sp.]